MVFWNGGSSLDLVFLPLDSQGTQWSWCLRLKTKVCLKLLSRSLWPWPKESCCRGGCPQGKPDWFERGLSSLKPSLWLNLGQCLPLRKTSWSHEVMPFQQCTIFSIQWVRSYCVLSYTHLQGLSTKWQRQRGKQHCHVVGCALKIWKVHTFSGRQGSETTENPGWRRRGVSWGALKCKVGKFQGMCFDLKRYTSSRRGGVGGVSSGVGAGPVLWGKIQDLL